MKDDTGGNTAFAALMAHRRETEALAQVAGRLGWDQEVVMPPGAAAQRAEESGAMEAVLHARRTDPRIVDWLAAARAPDAAGARALALIGRDLARSAAVPAALATEIARRTSLAQGIWAAARAANDPAPFIPELARLIALRREEGAALVAAGIGADPYEALLDGYEPGATVGSIAGMFARMRPRLVALRERVLGAPLPPALSGRFPAEAQMALARRVAGRFGYDWARGRLDLAVHPFSSGSGSDVRITTRIDEADPLNCLYSTIHETGHACYEQAIAPDYALSPLGQGVSMGVHESQSRIYENQIGRSRAYTGWLYGAMREAFGDFGIDGPDAFYAAINRVTSGAIRTEADELHYNLHIMLRFDLERALIGGQLAAGDVAEAWNTRFAADFGFTPATPAEGFLQDVHWSIGGFGYFPTYTLGNLYAGCLMRAIRDDLPGLDASLAAGDPAPATSWLRDRVQRHGGLHAPEEVIARACGRAPDEGPLLDYLEAKFGELYAL